MAKYIQLIYPDLVAELESRSLSTIGNKLTLLKRLTIDDNQAAKKTFTQFLRFPVEVQMLIWERSLPGPRILAVDPEQQTMQLQGKRSRRDPNKLFFPPSSHTPNPAALSTCRTSRMVALRRYRLCFGTHNVYADLAGGDILHFGPWTECFRYPDEQNETRLWTFTEPPEAVEEDMMEWTPISLRPSLRADLEQVTHIALDLEQLRAIYSDDSSVINVVPTLKRDMKRFKSLKRVYLIYDAPYPILFASYPAFFNPGQIIIEPAKFDWVYNMTENQSGDFPEIVLGPLSSVFDWDGDSDNLHRGGPELEIVIERRLDDTPMREYQEACGLERSELYYGSTDPDTYWLD